MLFTLTRFAALGLVTTGLTFSGTARAEESRPYHTMSEGELKQALADVKLGGPISMLAVGGGGVLLGGSFVISGLIYKNWSSYCYDLDCDDLGRTYMIAGGVLGGVGAAFAIGGGIWLGNRLGERRAIKKELATRTNSSQLEVRYGLVPLSTGLGVGASGTF